MFSFRNSTFISKLLISAIIFIVFHFLTKLLINIAQKSIKDLKKKFYFKKIVYYVEVVILLIILTGLWLKSILSFSAIIGLLSAGLIVVLRDLILDFIGWLFIIGPKGFDIGDRIEVEKNKGDVVEIGIFNTVLQEVGNWVSGDQTTGRLIIIPNNYIVTKHFVSYTSGFNFIWNELSFLITFESNWKKAKENILKIVQDLTSAELKTAEAALKKATRKFVIKVGILTPYVYVNISGSGIELVARYFTNVRKRRMTKDAINQSILDFVNSHDDVEFAYPTTRFINK